METNYLQSSALLEGLGVKPGENVLFVHAHPDDETILTGHAINQMTKAGANVHVLLATDGKQSAWGDPVLVQAGYRRIEAMLALAELLVPLERQYYLGMEDGKLNSPENQLRLARHIGKVLSEKPFSGVFTPSEDGFDGHPDHIAAHQAATVAVKNAVQKPKIWSLGPPGGGVTVAADAETKISASKNHATQYPDIFVAIAGVLRPYFGLIFLGEHYHANTLYYDQEQTYEAI